MKKYIAIIVALLLLIFVTTRPDIKKQKEYIVVYFVGKGSEQIPSITVPSNGKTYEPAPPVRESAEFDGWYTVLNPTDEDEEFDFNTRITKSITLYAKWLFDDYQITYVLSGGKWPDDEKPANYPDSFTKDDKNIFLKVDSKTYPQHDSFGRFIGWRTIPQSEYVLLSKEEQKDYPEITNFKPDDSDTLIYFDEDKHITLYAYYRNFEN